MYVCICIYVLSEYVHIYVYIHTPCSETWNVEVVSQNGMALAGVPEELRGDKEVDSCLLPIYQRGTLSSL